MIWMARALTVAILCVLQISCQEGPAESVSFHGYLPRYRALSPVGDGHANDIYQHLRPAAKTVPKDHRLLYPEAGFILEIHQDPEGPAYVLEPDPKGNGVRSAKIVSPKPAITTTTTTTTTTAKPPHYPSHPGRYSPYPAQRYPAYPPKYPAYHRPRGYRV